MAFLLLSDFNGSVDSVAFPKVWKDIEETVKSDNIYGFKGKFESRQDKLSFIIEKIVKPEELEPQAIREAHIALVKEFCNKSLLHELLDTCITYSGPCSLSLHIIEEEQINEDHQESGLPNSKKTETLIKAAREFSVCYDEQLIQALQKNQAVSSVWFD